MGILLGAGLGVVIVLVIVNLIMHLLDSEPPR